MACLQLRCVVFKFPEGAPAALIGGLNNDGNGASVHGFVRAVKLCVLRNT